MNFYITVPIVLLRDEEYRISGPSSSQIQRYFSTNDKVRSRVPRIEHAHPCLFDPFREDGQSFSYLTAHPPLSTSSLSENPLQEISNLRWISASNRHLYRISPMVNRDSPANFLFNFNPFSKIAPLPGETLMVHHGAAFPPSREGKWAARVESSFESPSHENKRACSLRFLYSITLNPFKFPRDPFLRHLQRIVVIEKGPRSLDHFSLFPACSSFRRNDTAKLKFVNLRPLVFGRVIADRAIR